MMSKIRSGRMAINTVGRAGAGKASSYVKLRPKARAKAKSNAIASMNGAGGGAIKPRAAASADDSGADQRQTIGKNKRKKPSLY